MRALAMTNLWILRKEESTGLTLCKGIEYTWPKLKRHLSFILHLLHIGEGGREGGEGREEEREGGGEGRGRGRTGGRKSRRQEQEVAEEVTAAGRTACNTTEALALPGQVVTMASLPRRKRHPAIQTHGNPRAASEEMFKQRLRTCSRRVSPLFLLWSWR